jgi:hypothetical protein
MAVHNLSWPADMWHPTSDITSWASAQRQVKQSSISVPSPRFLEWLFDDSTDEYIVISILVPNNYVGTPILKVFYKCTSATSGTAAWEARLHAVTDADATDIDADAYATVNAGTGTVAATAGHLDVISITLSNADGIAANDFVSLALNRDVSADSVSGDLEFIGAQFSYADA